MTIDHVGAPKGACGKCGGRDFVKKSAQVPTSTKVAVWYQCQTCGRVLG